MLHIYLIIVKETRFHALRIQKSRVNILGKRNLLPIRM